MAVNYNGKKSNKYYWPVVANLNTYSNILNLVKVGLKLLWGITTVFL
jgi:hypothetical protein